jgi:hypothetical protein
MKTQRDIERILDQWFSDGPTVVPDRVIDVATDRIERQSQRPAWRLDWRQLAMNRTFMMATAVAAIAIVAILGYNLLPAGLAGVGGAGSTPTPSPSPIPIVDGPLAAGTYALNLASIPDSGLPSTFPKMIVTVPDGWTGSPGLIVKGIDDATHDPSMAVWPNVYLPTDEVYAHPCQWSGVPQIQPGPTVDGLASALAAVPLRNATTPVDVTVDGYNGKYLEWSVPDDIDFATCDKEDGEARFQSWTGRWQQGPGQVDRLWILDIDGARFVIDAFFLKETTEAERAELTKIMASIRFQP